MLEDSIALDTFGNMPEFCASQAQQIETEIERLGVALGINWEDEVAVRRLARESLEHLQSDVKAIQQHHDDYHLRAKVTLFAMANIMLELMAKSADRGIHTHGGVAWKAFSRALMLERQIQGWTKID